ncbi:hypothetical protein [Algoriphagus hitonicola]|uniref:TonB protein C-terminal n=1 Tax=Algoriphagus hitonicola TaxID=435880 RepID=A0A1I2XIH0_9BACT|nr:hypothetical protein [Algoriphagus hitonicola]SFH11871.1 hypothetical protein SAMN04487988_11838 [Algoriphagus hitonicola]
MKKHLLHIAVLGLAIVMLPLHTFAASDKDEKASLRAVVAEEKAESASWKFADFTVEMIDSYSPFIFRTKKSQQLEEVRVILEVNSMGAISGFELENSEDKGLKERLDYVIRKLPKCEPIPGKQDYGPQSFELIIQK